MTIFETLKRIQRLPRIHRIAHLQALVRAEKPRSNRRAELVAGVVALAVMIGLDRPTAANVEVVSSRGPAEAFSQRKLDGLLASGQPVFVNMTAAWCITCLVNERTALSTDAVREAFAGKRIAYLKGDWTNRNPEITRLLERFGRNGVPLYVLFRSGTEPVVLPQILTQSLVLDALAQI